MVAEIPEALAIGEYRAFVKTVVDEEDLMFPFVSVKVSLSRSEKVTPFQQEQWDKILNDPRITKRP